MSTLRLDSGGKPGKELRSMMKDLFISELTDSLEIFKTEIGNSLDNRLGTFKIEIVNSLGNRVQILEEGAKLRGNEVERLQCEMEVERIKLQTLDDFATNRLEVKCTELERLQSETEVMKSKIQQLENFIAEHLKDLSILQGTVTQQLEDRAKLHGTEIEQLKVETDVEKAKILQLEKLVTEHLKDVAKVHCTEIRRLQSEPEFGQVDQNGTGHLKEGTKLRGTELERLQCETEVEKTKVQQLDKFLPERLENKMISSRTSFTTIDPDAGSTAAPDSLDSSSSTANVQPVQVAVEIACEAITSTLQSSRVVPQKLEEALSSMQWDADGVAQKTCFAVPVSCQRSFSPVPSAARVTPRPSPRVSSRAAIDSGPSPRVSSRAVRDSGSQLQLQELGAIPCQTLPPHSHAMLSSPSTARQMHAKSASPRPRAPKVMLAYPTHQLSMSRIS
eukprot:gnl/TRDRNA2_/TRDRNA2_64415_c0_seq1.p1 gnl/TRDRNA2_/TRDRNA2_64415_c0~~gnl/TRDRNA2_/TRDRNA2_64415_c0_seq1.p1  ORF type:complete len:447 (-),score=78.94 gnl/TRDRNA2_/TRDRNA2_64415_c0_seq1:38-1378(-)